MLQLVVARYEENLSWLFDDPVLSQIDRVVYNKGSELHGSVGLPNIGREAHTWLHHIIENYDKLSEYTAFLQGTPHGHMSDVHGILSRFPFSMSRLVSIPGCHFMGIYWEDRVVDANLRQNMYFNKSKNCMVQKWYRLAPTKTFNMLFRNYPPYVYPYAMGAQYIVHRRNIVNKPLRFYQRAMRILNWDDHEAWNMEHLWPQVFDPDDKWMARY